MTDWEQLIAEGKGLDEQAGKIQGDKEVALSKAEIDTIIHDYHSWYGKSLAGLPEDLKVKFRAEFEGAWPLYKIKHFLNAPTELNIIHQKGDEATKAFFPYWAYPYVQNFHPYILSQIQILIEANERPEPTSVNNDNLWNVPMRRIFSVFLEKAKTAGSNVTKKLSYEYLAIFLITSIGGLTVIGHDTRGTSEEIDLWVENDSTNTFWQKVGPVFIVECKNWSEPVGAAQVRNLSSIMESKNITFAILMSKNGITGDERHDSVALVREYFKKGRCIIVLDQSDLEEIARGVDPTTKIKQKYRELVMKS